jgi:hypothetical protein
MILSSNIKFRSALTAIALIAALGGCASTPSSTPQMAVAVAAVQHATTTSTSEGAPGELQVATAKLAAAQAAEARKDYVLAAQLADETEVDAQVAELHAQSARSRKAATETQDAARVLSEELSRKTQR